VNPNLVGAKMSCPQCGTRIDVPKEKKTAPAPVDATPPPKPAPKAKVKAARPAPKPEPKAEPAPVRLRFTVWLLAAQVVLLGLGAACIWGAFMAEEEGLPEWSFLRYNSLYLAGAGILLLVLGAAAGHAPTLWTLTAVLFVLGACSYHYYSEGVVDASRTLALSLTMLALWLALQHRRAASRGG
jgi:hypothetical protein